MITGQKTSVSQPLRGLANLHNDGNMKELATSVNVFSQQVAADLRPLDDKVTPPSPDQIPAEFIDQAEVERKLSQIDIYKAPGPDGLLNWVLRDFFLHNTVDWCVPSTMPQYVTDLFHSAGRIEANVRWNSLPSLQFCGGFIYRLLSHICHMARSEDERADFEVDKTDLRFCPSVYDRNSYFLAKKVLFLDVFCQRKTSLYLFDEDVGPKRTSSISCFDCGLIHVR